MDAFGTLYKNLLTNYPWLTINLRLYRTIMRERRFFQLPNGTWVAEALRGGVVFTDFPNEDYNHRLISYADAEWLINLFADELEIIP